MQLHVHGISDVGCERQQNEDMLHIGQLGDGSWLLVVCDGMGGHEAGNVASEVATRRIVEQVTARVGDPSPAKVIWDALVSANDAVREQAAVRGVPSMGTTAVVGWVVDGALWCGWVGDSRLYHYRRGAIETRTEDHTRVQRMVEMQILSEEEAKHHPEAHVLTQALGGGSESQAGFRPSVWGEPSVLEPSDTLILCSDGLYDLVDDVELFPLVGELAVGAAVARLIDTANERGGHDNVTVVVASVGDPVLPTAPPPDPRRTLVDTPAVPASRPPPPQAGNLFAPLPAPAASRPQPGRSKAWLWAIVGVVAGVAFTLALALLLLMLWRAQQARSTADIDPVAEPTVAESEPVVETAVADDDSAEEGTGVKIQDPAEGNEEGSKKNP
jgi:serine/threonine protein phosphatase PrpC